MREIDLHGERLFENKKVAGGSPRTSQSKYYWATALGIENHRRMILESVRDKRVLEIGCSAGSLSLLLAQVAALYVGTDISDGAVTQARKAQVADEIFLCADGHNVPIRDGMFDCVVVDALLHHMDLSRVLPEIDRLLVPSGRIFFNEPLGTNPIFNLYRFLTPTARTPDERPFTRSDIKMLQDQFEIVKFNMFGFSSILSAFLRLKFLRTLLSRVDSVLALTPLKWFFWQFAGAGEKRDIPR